MKEPHSRLTIFTETVEFGKPHYQGFLQQKLFSKFGISVSLNFPSDSLSALFKLLEKYRHRNCYAGVAYKITLHVFHRFAENKLEN